MRNFTAMVLDDHYLVRRGFEAVAQSIPGLSIIGSYERSRDLLTALSLQQPELLFLDFSLHVDDMDGLTLIRLIKRRFNAIKIIVISAHARAGIASLALRAGAEGFCSKGTSASELNMATNCVLAGRIYVPEYTEPPPLCPRAPLDSSSDNISFTSRPNAFESLTAREREVINLTLMGMSISEISQKLSRDRKTISGHKQSAYRKLGLSGDANLFSIRHLLE